MAPPCGKDGRLRSTMLKASRLVPLGTSDRVNAGGFDVQPATQAHEKSSDIATAKWAMSTATMVVMAAATAAMRRCIAIHNLRSSAPNRKSWASRTGKRVECQVKRG